MRLSRVPDALHPYLVLYLPWMKMLRHGCYSYCGTYDVVQRSRTMVIFIYFVSESFDTKIRTSVQVSIWLEGL